MGPKKTNQGTAANAAKAKKPAKGKTATPPKTPNKRVAPEDIPEYDKNITSKNYRNKRRYKLTRALLFEDVDMEEITNLAKQLKGESLYSWGVDQTSPIEALPKKTKARRGPKFYTDQANYFAMVEGIEPKRQVIPNSPDRSPILRLSLEIREEIYSYLLIHPNPIMVKPDFTTVERNPFEKHNNAILYTCKQFAEEASIFRYKSNTFQAILRNEVAINRRREDPILIDAKFLSLFRDIIIKCSQSCWDLDWYERVAKGLERLVKAKPVLRSLTLILFPQRVGFSSTALGEEYNPITFADFLWYDGPLMTAIRTLSPKNLNIIVKKSGDTFHMSVNMTDFKPTSEPQNPFANPVWTEISGTRSDIVDQQLVSLKDRFEEIFEASQ